MLHGSSYKYMLFDFDGTLVDTNELIILALRKTCKSFLGRELSDIELNSVLGKYLEDQMRLLSPSQYEKMVLYYKEFYKAKQDSMIYEFPGVRQMLKSLRELGCKTAVVSAKGRGGIEHGLKRFGMEQFIDVIISAYDIKNNKPHPEPALKALEALKGTADQALMIGDSPYDILCGKNAGIKTVLVDWTIFPKSDILKISPDFHIMSPQQLADIVKSSARI